MDKTFKLISVLTVLGIIFIGGLFFLAGDDKHSDNSAMMVQEDHHGDEDDDEVTGYEIYPGDVATKISQNEDIILLDVRTLEEYEEVHLENALLLPVQELSQKSLNEIGLGENAKDKEIILYCRSGARSKTAYDIMTSLGYTNVKSSAGGMIHWEEDNYPYTETGSYMAPDTVDEGEVVTTGPKVTLDRTSHNFGVITQYGGKVETTFNITNTGTELLEIGTLTTSCSCTSAYVENDQIEPNESTSLTVVFDPDFHEEPLDEFKRTVFIPTNDSSTAEAEVSILVDIAEGE